MERDRRPYLTPEEYLEREREAGERSEYWAGKAYAMTGTSNRHSLIVTNLVGNLFVQFKGRPCEVHASEMRVRVRAADLYTYPDIAIVCGGAEFEDEREDNLLNPSVLIEVLSPSTESYDRGAKFRFYRSLESLTDYLLVAQDEPVIEHYVRRTDGEWALRSSEGLAASIEIESAGARLALVDVYDRVKFPPPELRPLRRVKEDEAEYLPRPGMYGV